MEFRISVQELSKILSATQGIVQRKNTIPILANVLLEVGIEDNGQGRLFVSATDLDVGMKTSRACEVIEAGVITIPAKSLADTVRVLPGPDAHIKVLDNSSVEIKSGRMKAKLIGISAEEFPNLPDFSQSSFSSLNIDIFLEMVEKTIYASSTDETRYNLNGVLFECNFSEMDDFAEITMVATDGHRLVRIERSFKSFFLEEIKERQGKSIILPRKGLHELKRLLQASEKIKNQEEIKNAKLKQQEIEKAEYFEIAFNENQIIFKYKGSSLNMRLIDGTFPDYKQVIPNIADKVLRLSRKDLLASLKRVSVLASDKMQPVKLNISENQLEISCSNPDMGDINDDVPIEYQGDALEIAFNAKYLGESLSSFDEGDVLLKLTDNLSPGVLLGVDDAHYLCVVMPMRL